MSGVPKVGGVDDYIVYLILNYLRSRSRETFSFRTKQVSFFIETHMNGNRYTTPSPKKVSVALSVLSGLGVVSVDDASPVGKRRYVGSKSRVDQFIKNLKEVKK